jgi:ATP-dependent RNA helicase SUPV3L1/SUV3
MPLLRKALAAPVTPIQSAGLFPTVEQFELFAEMYRTAGPGMRNVKFSRIMRSFLDAVSLTNEYFLCGATDTLEVASLLDDVPLNLKDRYTFCMVRRIDFVINAPIGQMSSRGR